MVWDNIQTDPTKSRHIGERNLKNAVTKTRPRNEGKITKNDKKVKLKQGLFRLAKLARKKGESIKIVPVGIAYENVSQNSGMDLQFA